MGLFGGGAESVIAKGTRLAGTIVGIEVRRPGEGEAEPVRSYGVRLGDGRTIGIRQRLDPADVVRLGMTVGVVARGNDGVIAAEPPFDHVDTGGWKALKQPPADGIDDDTLGLSKAKRKHAAATVRLTALGRTPTMFGLGSTLSCTLVVRLDGEPPYEIETSWGGVPNYATHLVSVDRELPAFVDRQELDEIWIDWPAAATRDPGIGVAPAGITRHGADSAAVATGLSAGPVGEALTARVAAAAGGAQPVDASESIDGVTFEQWISIEAELSRTGLRNKPKQWDAVAAQHGVGTGVYAQVSAKWARAMISRPDLATRYAEAIR